ncbi:MAG: CoA transferase, partial [Pseudomonadota bacterium]
ADQMDKNRWPAARKTLAALFASEPQNHWCERFEGTDVCFAPVLTLSEAAAHPHMVHRKTFVENEGSLQPAPAPRLERTPARAGPLPQTGADTDKVLQEAGYSKAAIDALRQEGAI